MPMYEKGSVRAEPRSKQQERMKKIMKKFLSSLLALTMILSLVIVPANAADASFTAKASKTSNVRPGDTITLTAESVQPGGDDSSKTATIESINWTKKNDSTEIEDGVYTVAKEDIELTFTGTATIKWGDTDSDKSTNVTADTTKITVVKFSPTDVDYYTFNGRKYTNASDIKYVEGETLSSDSITVRLKNGFTMGSCTYDSNTNALTVKGTHNNIEETFTVNSFNPSKVTLDKPTIAIKDNTVHTKDGKNYIREGEKGVLKVDYSPKLGTDSKDLTYQWKEGSSDLSNGRGSTYDLNGLAVGEHKITVTVKEGTSASASVTSDVYTLTVEKDNYKVKPTSGYKTSMAPGQRQSLSISVTGTGVVSPEYSVVWSSSNTAVADFTDGSKRDTTGVLVAGNKSGSTTVTAKVTFENKDYTVTFDSISVSAADATLGEITNGSSDYLSDSSLKDTVAKAIKKSTGSSVTASDIDTIKVATAGFPSHVTLYEDEVKSANKITSTTKDLTTVDDLYFDTDAGYIGTAELNLNVTLKAGGNGTIAVTLYIPVVGNETIKDTVTGTSANKEVTFTNDDYDYLYYSYSKPTYEGYFNGNKVDGFEYPVKEGKTVTVPASKFNSSKTVTLYVVGVDSKGVASTGTITVSQKSYDISYNVVAGKSVSFSQKDFEDFLEDYAEDDGKYNPKKDDISFDHAVLTSSVPSTKNEGTLYDGSTEITSSNKSKTKMTDMDKVSFDTVSKPSKDTITLTFKVYGEVEKPNSRKPDEVKYDVNVVINVVKEDITYTVGIDDTVQLTARDFVNFLQDARTSYRKAELDYVKFDVSGKNVSSYAYGGLYRSYSSYSTGKLADSTDKFYYEPSRTQYDLADVAYHTTRWAEAGKTVYIPFTVYGTKGEEASGTMAITIAQTMNFIDVKPGDFFYEPVKWAVNNKITNGTSSTTFSPYKNCNRAEIVTFLWRAAGTPEPTVTRNPFTDVNSVRDASYYKAILWASQKGITAGSTATTFSPYQECTRSQIVTFLYRYAGKPSGYYSNPFKDVSSVNEASYYNAILWAVGKGITDGTSTTTFSPYASCTRGQAVTFLYRYVNGVK